MGVHRLGRFAGGDSGGRQLTYCPSLSGAAVDVAVFREQLSDIPVDPRTLATAVLGLSEAWLPRHRCCWRLTIFPFSIAPRPGCSLTSCVGLAKRR